MYLGEMPINPPNNTSTSYLPYECLDRNSHHNSCSFVQVVVPDDLGTCHTYSLCSFKI